MLVGFLDERDVVVTGTTSRNSPDWDDTWGGVAPEQIVTAHITSAVPMLGRSVGGPSDPVTVRWTDNGNVSQVVRMVDEVLGFLQDCRDELVDAAQVADEAYGFDPLPDDWFDTLVLRSAGFTVGHDGVVRTTIHCLDTVNELGVTEVLIAGTDPAVMFWT